MQHMHIYIIKILGDYKALIRAISFYRDDVIIK